MGTSSFKQIKSFMLLEYKISMGKLVEQRIKKKADNLAVLISLFIQSQPCRKVEELVKDPRFMAMVRAQASQNIDAVLYNSQGVNLLHVDPSLVGINLRELFTGNPEMLRLVDGGFKNTTSGYYD
jgi:hypothetical protein